MPFIHHAHGHGVCERRFFKSIRDRITFFEIRVPESQRCSCVTESRVISSINQQFVGGFLRKNVIQRFSNLKCFSLIIYIQHGIKTDKPKVIESCKDFYTY